MLSAAAFAPFGRLIEVPDRAAEVARDNLEWWGELYDLEFPEPARVLCLAGAEILLSMAAHWTGTGTVGGPENFIRTIYAARALENRVPVVLSNRVGFDPGLDDNFVGLSRIVDADGVTVAAMPDDQEGMIVATLDLNEERKKRQRYNYYRDRKPWLYASLAHGQPADVR